MSPTKKPTKLNAKGSYEYKKEGWTDDAYVKSNFVNELSPDNIKRDSDRFKAMTDLTSRLARI